MSETEAATVEPSPQQGLDLQKGASPHEAAKALSERRKRVGGSTKPPVDPNKQEAPTQEIARPAESQGDEAEASPASTEPEEVIAPSDGDTPDEAGASDFPTTVRGLAEALEVDPDDFVTGITIDVNGEEIPISELRAGHLRQSDYSRSQDKLAEERRTFEAERDRTLERAKQQVETAENWMGVLSKALEAGPSEAEMATLAQTDPGKYVAEKARKDNLMNAYNQVATERQGMIQNSQKEQHDARMKAMDSERQQLVRMSQDKSTGIPNPNDHEKWAGFEGKIRNYLTNVGFQEPQVAEFLTPGGWTAPQVKIIADAMRGKAVLEDGAGVGKKVKHLPKTLKPGAPKDRQQSASDKIAKARSRLRKQNTGRAGDQNAIALLRAQRQARKG